jgi:hypothetical protein
VIADDVDDKARVKLVSYAAFLEAVRVEVGLVFCLDEMAKRAAKQQAIIDKGEMPSPAQRLPL